MSTKTRSEQETIVRRAADEDEWEVFSEDPAVMRKLSGLYGPGREKGLGAVWMVPRKGLSFRRPVVLSDSEKASRAAILRERLARKANG